MLTSPGLPGDGARCRDLGIAAYLTGPLNQSDLLHAVETVLSRPSPAEAARALVTRHLIRETAGRKLNILLVDDNPVNQKLAVLLVEKRGHRVAVAATGLEALVVLEKRQFDVVLMDVQMPEMNEFEATARIREREKLTGAHLPIIAMTASALKGDRELCLEAGMDNYLAKPIKPAELYACLDQISRTVNELELTGT